ncbi:MAG TPA: DUF4956 domain-containing protein, partial [Micrococcaceae bacterium]|nr:DUF4956 domain-containing protein [Micrococcaceae bacterium]
ATAALVLVMYVADHPSFAPRTERQTVTLEKAYAQKPDLVAALEDLLNAKVLRTVVVELDMVRDLTIVDVRFRTNKHSKPQQQVVLGGTYELAKASPASATEAKQESWSK